VPFVESCSAMLSIASRSMFAVCSLIVDLRTENKNIRKLDKMRTARLLCLRYIAMFQSLMRALHLTKVSAC
jgi:hypothetical protein